MSALVDVPHPYDERIRRMTLDEWARLDDDDNGELVDGWLMEDEMSDYVHELVVSWFVARSFDAVDALGGWVAASNLKLATGARSGRMPDAAIFLAKRPPARGVVLHPPEVVVEVVSPTPRDARRDRIEKLAEYAAFGVKWYWIVDPQLRSFEVLERDDQGRYVHVRTGTDGVLGDIPGCPGLQFDLSDLWRRVDALLAPPPAGDAAPEAGDPTSDSAPTTASERE
jgi:Uma2 family endonuclease